MKIILVKTDNTYEVKDVDDVSKVLNGWMEIVSPKAAYRDNLLLWSNVFVCDEEGHPKGLKENWFGTLLYNGLKPAEMVYLIVGDIFLIGVHGEDFRGLTDDEIEYYVELLETVNIRRAV